MWTLDTRIDVTRLGRSAVSRRPEAPEDLTPEEIVEAFAPLLPHERNPRFCPSTCPACGIGNIYGPPACFDRDCPNPLKVNR